MPSTAAIATQWRQPFWRRIADHLVREATRRAASPPVVVSLADGHSHVMRDAAGTRVSCEAGEVWITQQCDPDDITLEAGQSADLVRRGKTVALAIGDCRLRIER